MIIKVDNLALFRKRPNVLRYEIPLLLIHGAWGTSRYWSNYLSYFADAGWDVFAVNLRGHHPSDPERSLAQVKLEDYLDDVEKVIKRLDISHCVLIGHSLGGLIAQKTAENIQSISGLITLASAPPFGIAQEVNMNHHLSCQESFVEAMWGLMNMKPVKPTYSMAEKTVLNNIAPDERKAIFDMFVAESLVVGFQVTQGYPVFPSQIKCPKLVIGCAKDALAPASTQRSLSAMLHADYIQYDQFGHLPMLEAGWQKSAEDIQNWLIKNTINKRKESQ